MPVTTITEPTVDEILRQKIQKYYQKQNAVAIEADQKFAIVLIELNPAVTQANYAALGAAINAIQGIDGVSLLIDGKTPANTPTDATYEIFAKAWLAVKDNPVEPEP